MTPRDLTGQRFGRLTVIGRGESRRYACGSVRSMWRAACDCGSEPLVDVTALTRGRTRSCGCLERESRLTASRTHGMRKSPEYRSWVNMVTRCYVPSSESYPQYGGRGIRVCEDWRRSFAAFYRDVGPRPSRHHSIDRVDVNGNYEPENVRWATALEQARNRRDSLLVTVNGNTRCVAEWAALNGINPYTIYKRISKGGWTPERAVTTPARHITRRAA